VELQEYADRNKAGIVVWIEPRTSDGALNYLIQKNWSEAVQVIPKGTHSRGLIKPKVWKKKESLKPVEGVIGKVCLYS
jgi:hypothetical protein